MTTYRSKQLGLTALVITLILAAGFTYRDIQKAPDFPEDVVKVLQNSCYACHTTDAKAPDAKAAMDFQMWDEYKLTKKISLLNRIGEVMEEGAMPPKKFLGYYPDKALSGEQVELIKGWTDKETEKLMK